MIGVLDSEDVKAKTIAAKSCLQLNARRFSYNHCSTNPTGKLLQRK